MQSTLQKIKKEHQFWNERFRQIIKGFSDSELNEVMVQFVNELNFADLSEAEKELIFSKEMNINTIGTISYAYVYRKNS